MAVLDSLRRRHDFTSTEEALAAYVLEHADDVAEMSIAQLSVATHTSNAAVVRFCHKLGIDGYRAFRIELARELERARNGVLDVNPDQPFLENVGTRDIMSSIASLSKQAIDATYATVSSTHIRKLARLVTSARHVALYAVGDTEVSLDGFSNLLLKSGIACIKGFQHNDDLVVSNFLGSSDVAIVVTYSGSLVDHELVDLLPIMKSRGCKVAVISADESIPQRHAGIDCMVVLPKGESRKGRIATYFSQACIRFVLNCVYGEIYARTWEQSSAMLDRYNQHVEDPQGDSL